MSDISRESVSQGWESKHPPHVADACDGASHESKHQPHINRVCGALPAPRCGCDRTIGRNHRSGMQQRRDVRVLRQTATAQHLARARLETVSASTSTL
jgi:hypothetical protein